jgi:hypothetical protein
VKRTHAVPPSHKTMWQGVAGIDLEDDIHSPFAAGTGYSALLRRDSLALTLHLLTNETDDAAELICGLGPRGDFQTGATTLADLSTQMAALKEKCSETRDDA